jgi:hypothetical protein
MPPAPQVATRNKTQAAYGPVTTATVEYNGSAFTPQDQSPTVKADSARALV